MGFESRHSDLEQIDEDLVALDQGTKRLRIEYDQYFLGVLKRPPTVLLGKIQKLIIQFASSPPRNTRQKFRFNQLNSKFQMMRQQWGRIQRQIEAGTYKPHRFRAKLHEQEGPADASPPEPARDEPSKAAGAPRSGLDLLYDALTSARRKTGEHGDLDRQALERVVRQQGAAIREKYGDAKVRFKVVIEDNRAKVKATVSRT